MADCVGCPEITLSELGEELLAQLQGRRYPLGGSLELTERCNLRCVHCYINQPAGSAEAAAREMTLPQVQTVLDKVAGAGCLFLLVTGGEPLLRPDFAEIWRYAKQKGLVLTLFTNGTLLTPRMADFLAEYRPHVIEITLYGATQGTYERVTGVPGSYARCMRAIDLLLERGLRLDLKSVLLRSNRHELEAMRVFAEGLGALFRFDGVLWPRLDGGQAALAERLPPEEVVALDREYPERQWEYKDLIARTGPGQVRGERVYACGAGQRSFHLDCAGQLSVCMMTRRPAYDLLRGSFQEGWEKVLGAELSKVRTLESPCPTCTVGVLCTQCPGWSQAVHGDDETPVDYVCKMGQLRAAQIASTPIKLDRDRRNWDGEEASLREAGPEEGTAGGQVRSVGGM